MEIGRGGVEWQLLNGRESEAQFSNRLSKVKGVCEGEGKN